MWLFLRESFVSVVQHDDEHRLLVVRSRLAGDIERLFPEAEVAEDPVADYRFCATVPRDRVAQVVANRIQHIDYPSLNEAVEGTERSLGYDRAYGVMLEEQVARYGSQDDDPVPAFTLPYDLNAEA